MHTIAVDIGGTFTDVIVIDDATGRTHMGKALTTPAAMGQLGFAEAQAAFDADWPTFPDREGVVVTTEMIERIQDKIC